MSEWRRLEDLTTYAHRLEYKAGDYTSGMEPLRGGEWLRRNEVGALVGYLQDEARRAGESGSRVESLEAEVKRLWKEVHVWRKRATDRKQELDRRERATVSVTWNASIGEGE